MRHLIVVILLLALWFFAGSFVTETKDQAVYGLTQVLLWPKWLVKGLFNPALEYQAVENLKLKNENLKAKIFALQQAYPETQTTGSTQYLVAKIYSRSPFNNKDTISVNKGLRDGVREGMVATVGGDILLGQVEQVFEKYSLVKTIFTSDWQLPVRIGEIGAEGLLTGGSELKVSMIAGDKEVAAEQLVFAASPDFPYGMVIGVLQDVKPAASANVFKEATAQVSYNFNDLTNIWLLKSF